ncbi:unnamed protein product [Rotaria magnacalcarata]|uniref:Uncharacterized protein n=2 Tax=Rotaria magnacalcarata TaxID=392030 RepID=A0A814TWK9_9BILA|nr:unnamed protein product [Rotaria magnacalcarata]CAF1239356.1 unnamed protein product [Rotaria magnacalcarata]CAF2131481.1 unnamed protein product [Rotaria magnacalcarata]CAF3782923.1 unnamed protein product [Rotaria magnacalcarata]CAF4086042.1 unnamed protein product [Rotaria magnacalcarata]
MLATQIAPPVDKAGISRYIPAVPILAICCLGLLLLVIAATIILALIPLYVPDKNIDNLVTTSTKYFTLDPLSAVTENGITTAETCRTISNSLESRVAIPFESLIPISCTFASQSSGRRRRSSYAYRRFRRQSGTARLFMKAIINYTRCPLCRSKTYLSKWINQEFSSTFAFNGTRSISFTVYSISSNAFTGLSPTGIVIP